MDIKEAIHLNNQVASLLESNRFREALYVSCTAMELFQNQQSTAKQGSFGGNKSAIDQHMLASGGDCSSDDTSDDFVYGHGVVLPLNTLDGTVITPVLIFNCALCHHLGARHCNEYSTSQAFLNKARRLYEIAYSEQDQVWNTLFKFAIVNNVGVIHKQLGSNEEAEACFNHLTSISMVYSISDESKHLQCVQGFWKNVLGNGSSIAPAAA
ncbi:MAG: hypothetical protein SGBAC_011002 [Bacillariaceae sp.]